MKILIISQYFWPENFRINHIAEDFLNRGYEVDVITGYPNYPDGKIFSEFKKDKKKFNNYLKATIHRVPVVPRGKNRVYLVLNYVSFVFTSFFYGILSLRNKHFDTIFVFAPSPISVAIPAILIGKIKKIPVVLWVLDLWPETLSGLDVIKRGSIIFNIFRKLVKYIYSNSRLILCQSNSFVQNIKLYSKSKDIYVTDDNKKKLMERIIQDINFDLKAYPHLRLTNELIKKVRHFPAWPENVSINNERTTPHTSIQVDKNRFNLMFAGNIGEAQDFPSIIKTAKILKQRGEFRWLIVGGGRMFDWLKKEVNNHGLEEHFHLLGYYPLSDMPSFYLHADALVVTLKKDSVFEWTIPGKIQSYLTAYKPILGMLNGEGADVIIKANAGITCEAGDYIKFAEIIQEMKDRSPEQRNLFGRSAHQYAQDNFDRKILFNNLNLWMNEIKEDKIIT